MHLSIRTLRLVIGMLLGVCATCSASMYRVREVEGNSSLLVFRDVAQPNAFYFVPTAFGLVTSGSGPRAGIQYYSEGKSKSVLSAAVTLSVVAKVTQAQLNDVVSSIRQQFKLDNPKLTPPPRIRNRLVAYRVDQTISTLGNTQWSDSVVDASQSIAFNLSHISRSDLKRLLSADSASLAVVVELQLDGVVDGVASGRIQGGQVRDLSRKKSILGEGSDFESFLSDFLDHAVEIAPQDKPFLREATRSWIIQRLGPPSLLKVNQKFLYGWELADSALAKADDESIGVVRGSPRDEGAAAIVDLGNLCGLIPTAILDLDEGTSGCASLR